MKDDTYTKQLEESLHALIQIIVDPGLYNFLTDKERTKFGNILSKLPQK